MKKVKFVDLADTWFFGHTILHFEQSSKVEIGKHFVCNSGLYYGVDNFTKSKIICGKNGRLSFGDYSGITNTVIQCYNQVDIGNYVNIGAGTFIFDTNFHSVNWEHRKSFDLDQSNVITKPILICDNVFIGARCIICKGVTIGEKSMIAAGSVVVKNVPDGELWGGNPAKFIKKIS